MAKNGREVKKNIFYSKLKLKGLTLASLGTQLDPPVSRFRVWQIINSASPETRLKQIATILNTNIKTIAPRKENDHVN